MTEATPGEAGLYVASVAMGLGLALEDEQLHPNLQHALLGRLAQLVSYATAADADLANATRTPPQLHHRAGAPGWASRVRKAVDAVQGVDDTEQRVRAEQQAATWALVKAAGGRAELTPRQVLEAGDPANTLATWRDHARDVVVLEATP